MGKIETQDIQYEHPLTYHDFLRDLMRLASASTPLAYDKVRDMLLENRLYIEVPGTQGNHYMIRADNITCIEQEMSDYLEEKR